MSALIPVQFEGAAVRVVDVDGEPMFVGKDVAEVLGYANAADAFTRHCKGVAKRYPLQTPGGEQEVRVLSESDLLRLIIGSRLPAAERFERWVFEDVLPTIRRTGSYGPAIPQTLPEALRLAADLAEGKALAEAKARELELQVTEQAPKVLALAAIAGTEGSFCMRDAAKMLQVRPSELKQALLQFGWIHYRGATLHAYSSSLVAGYLTHKGVRIERSEGADLVTQVRITAKGITRLGELLQKAAA